MSWERANDRYKDHLDGQLTKQTGETNICGCGTGISPHGSQADHQVGLCEEEDHAERRRGGDRDHGGEQQLKTGRQRVGAGGDLIFQAIFEEKNWLMILFFKTLPFLSEIDFQEQSQEEDVKDCTGQISKPVS